MFWRLAFRRALCSHLFGSQLVTREPRIPAVSSADSICRSSTGMTGETCTISLMSALKIDTPSEIRHLACASAGRRRLGRLDASWSARVVIITTPEKAAVKHVKCDHAFRGGTLERVVPAGQAIQHKSAQE